MEKITKFIFELKQECCDDYEFNSKLIDEFFQVENELIEKLESNEEISQDNLRYRNKLNQLVSEIPPYAIGIYSIYDQLKKEEDSE
ncbi:MAG: hypothetical protein WAT71_12300 [Ignavibacteria bacterium]